MGIGVGVGVGLFSTVLVGAAVDAIRVFADTFIE